MRLPDGERSRAVLVGASCFADPDLPDLPAIPNNLTSLAEVLTAPSGTGLPAEHCAVLGDSLDVVTVGDQLERFAEQAEDLMLVYYAGHGLVDDRGRLLLAMPSTRLDRLRWTTLAWRDVRDVLSASPAGNKVLILDCCFSGRAIETMSEPMAVVSGQIEIAGTYTLTSTSRNAPASAPIGARYTAFSGELLDILNSGISDAGELLSFHAIYPHLDHRLRTRGLGRPMQSGVRTVDRLALVPNRAHRAPAPEPAAGAWRHQPTGLLTRDGFLQAAAERIGGHSVMVRADLDLPSALYDVLGPAQRNQLMIVAASRLRSMYGPGVPMGMLTPGKLAVLLKSRRGRVKDDVEQLVNLLSEPYPVARFRVEVAAVAGYAAVADLDLPAPDTDPDVDSLIQYAEFALHTAQKNQDGVCAYVPSMATTLLRRFHLVSQFRQAVRAGELLVYYQPKVSLPDHVVIGVEALIRWQHPEFGLLTPDEFVPAIEETTELLEVLTEFVLDKALGQARSWLDDGLRLSVAVNVSVRSLAGGNFAARVTEALVSHQLPAELLTLELTESSVMADPQHALPVLRHLHESGIVLSVDSFGTGYSSFAYLRRLPVEEVKIDRSFVFGMGSDLADLALVRSLVQLGHTLGLTVVAKGIEESTAMEQLTAMGCDVAQGYLLGRPMPPEQLGDWLRTRTRETTSGDRVYLG